MWRNNHKQKDKTYSIVYKPQSGELNTQLLEESDNQFCFTNQHHDEARAVKQGCQSLYSNRVSITSKAKLFSDTDTHHTWRANLTQTLPEYFPHYSQHQLLSLSRLVLVNKMRRERIHLFSGSCKQVLTDIQQNLTLKNTFLK